MLKMPQALLRPQNAQSNQGRNEVFPPTDGASAPDHGRAAFDRYATVTFD
jgi:hypothetical protein